MTDRENLMLKGDTQIPKYAQIKALLLSEIRSGQLAPGEKIPTEPQLCEQFGVSRITVRRAIEELVDDGYLLKKQGKGTFVRTHKIDRRVEYVMGFTESLTKAGYKPSSKVLECRLIHAEKWITEQLGDQSAEDVVYLKRLRMADNQPVMEENNYFPADRFGFLMHEDLSGSLYDLLERKHGIRPINPKTTRLGMTLADARLAKEMRVVIGTPCFEVHTLICDQDDRPVHVGHQFYLGEFYTFSL